MLSVRLNQDECETAMVVAMLSLGSRAKPYRVPVAQMNFAFDAMRMKRLTLTSGSLSADTHTHAHTQSKDGEKKPTSTARPRWPFNEIKIK